MGPDTQDMTELQATMLSWCFSSDSGKLSVFKAIYSIKIDMAFSTEFPKRPEKDAGLEPSDEFIAGESDGLGTEN